MWFTETPWPPIAILGLVGLAFAILAASKQSGKYQIAAVLCLLGCVAIWLIEREIVTEAERVEQRVLDLVAAFQRNDAEQTLSYFSSQAPDMRRLAEVALRMVDIDPDYRITDLRVTLRSNETLAEAHFRANADATLANFGRIGYKPTRWIVHWRKEAGEWAIIEVIRMSVVGEKRLGVLESGE